MAAKSTPKPATSKKTVCPVSREQFESGAKPLVITIGGQSFLADAKTFSTKSFGWGLNAQGVMDVAGTPVKVQIGMNITVANSKEAE